MDHHYPLPSLWNSNLRRCHEQFGLRPLQHMLSTVFMLYYGVDLDQTRGEVGKPWLGQGLHTESAGWESNHRPNRLHQRQQRQQRQRQ